MSSFFSIPKLYTQANTCQTSTHFDINKDGLLGVPQASHRKLSTYHNASQLLTINSLHRLIGFPAIRAHEVEGENHNILAILFNRVLDQSLVNRELVAIPLLESGTHAPAKRHRLRETGNLAMLWYLRFLGILDNPLCFLLISQTALDCHVENLTQSFERENSFRICKSLAVHKKSVALVMRTQPEFQPPIPFPSHHLSHLFSFS